MNMVLQALRLTDAPLRLLFTETGLLVGIINISLPFMVLPTACAVSCMTRLEQPSTLQQS